MKQQGLALVIVLWVISLLTLMAGSFALTVRRETTGVSLLKDQVKLQAAAETGVLMAKVMLTHPDALQRWMADGRRNVFNWQDFSVEVYCWAEQGKLDINRADENQLQQLFRNLNFEPEQQAALVDALIDWRDEDDWVRIHGAEKQQYQQQNKSYGPTNQPFIHLAELRQVIGFDDAVYAQIVPFLTVHSGQSRIDLRWASMAMKKIWQDEGDFSEVETDELAEPGEPAEGLALTQGMVVTVMAIASNEEGGQAGVQAVLKFQGGAHHFVLLDWQQGVDRLKIKPTGIQDSEF